MTEGSKVPYKRRISTPHYL